jgi:predicted outer membrane repeat protein
MGCVRRRGTPVRAGAGSGPGTCTSTELNAKLAGGGQFTFNCGPGPVTIAITSTPFITRDTTLDGGGVITISGGTTEQVFAVEGAGLTLNNLTVADGYRLGDGGAIYVYANARLTLVNTNFVGNHAQTVGGAILTDGQLTITGGLFYSNMANLSGGVIYNTGRAYIAGATFLSNTSGSGGGAIENAYLSVQSQMSINSSTLQGNISQGPGGAIHNLAGLTLEDDTLANNAAQGFTTGGGLADFDTSGDVYASTFSGNNAFGGAGMVISDSQSFIHESTFSANSAGGAAAPW